MDLSKLGIFAAYAAPIALVTAFWSQIRGWLDRVKSLLIVTISYDGSGSRAMLSYIWTHYKKVPFGYGAFAASDHFVRPIERHQLVGYEVSGQSLTFRKGWRWLTIVKEEQSGNNNGSYHPGVTHSGTLRISFIRGMFDPDKMFIEAIDFYNNMIQKTTAAKKMGGRYTFNRRFGNRGFSNKNSDYPDGVVGKAVDSTSPTDLLGARILRWKHEDLGYLIPNEPFKNLAYPPDILAFKKIIGHWMESEQWFKDKGLSWQIGAKFEGPPGTGKTSLVRALGQEFDLPIESFDLTSMSNQELTNNWRYALHRAPCIILFEDLDRIFDQDQMMLSSKNEMNPGVTLDCLLNCVSGIEEASGVIVIATVNDPSKIDPALTRPGRLDRTVQFGPLARMDRSKIARRILADSPELISQTVTEGDGETGAQFTKRCGDLATKERWRKHEQELLDAESASLETESARETHSPGVARDQYQANRFT